MLFSCWIFDSQKCSLPGNVRDHPRAHRDLRKFDTEKEVEVGGMGMEVGDRGGRTSQDWTRKRERMCLWSGMAKGVVNQTLHAARD